MNEATQDEWLRTVEESNEKASKKRAANEQETDEERLGKKKKLRSYREETRRICRNCVFFPVRNRYEDANWAHLWNCQQKRRRKSIAFNELEVISVKQAPEEYRRYFIRVCRIVTFETHGTHGTKKTLKD